MSNRRSPINEPGQPMIYQIRIKGHLGQQWTDWFEGLTITLEDNGDTLLTGPVVDQAALAWTAQKSAGFGHALDLGRSREIRPGRYTRFQSVIGGEFLRRRHAIDKFLA